MNNVIRTQLNELLSEINKQFDYKHIIDIVLGYYNLNPSLVAAGYHQHALVDADNRVWIWGDSELIQHNKKPVCLAKFSPHKIVQIATGYEIMLYLNKIGEVYVHGAPKSNCDGQLGIGTMDSDLRQYGSDGLKNRPYDPTTFAPTPIHPVRIEALVGKFICRIAAGRSHSLFLTNTGEVWGCGRNFSRILGVPYIDNLLVPAKNIELASKNIIDIVSGEFHCFFLDDQGEVFASGSNNSCCNGSGQFVGQTTQCVKFLTGKQIISIAACNAHSLFLDNTGKVWSCGNNQVGQLGLMNKCTRVLPVLIDDLKNEKIVQISAANNYSMFLSDSGKLWVCGLNNYGQFGLGHRTRYFGIKLVFSIEYETTRIKKIAAGYRDILFLTTTGELWMSGHTIEKQYRKSNEELYYPKRIDQIFE